MRRMAYAEDLHFERIGPLRMPRVPRLDLRLDLVDDLSAGAKPGVKPGASISSSSYSASSRCDSHSFELETGASLAEIEKLRARTFQVL